MKAALLVVLERSDLYSLLDPFVCPSVMRDSFLSVCPFKNFKGMEISGSMIG